LISISASFWLHGLHFTAYPCSSWNAASCFISTCTSSGSSTLAVDSFNRLPVELFGTQPLERGNWRCRHSWIKHKWCLSCTHNPWREGTGGADTAWIKHKSCGISFILWTSCPSSEVHHTYVATESKTISLYIHGPVMKRSSKWWNKEKRTQQAILLDKSLLFT
jgi:hypothetical protein